MKRGTLLRDASAACGALALAGGANAAGAATPDGSAATPENPHDAELDRLLADDWRDYHRRHPESASYDGDHAYDDRWDDPSEAAAADEASHQREVLARLQAIDRAQLSATGRTNADLYAERLRDALRGFELRTYLLALNQRGGVQTDVSIVDSLPFATLADYEAWATRVDRWPAKVDATIAVLRQAVARRMLWPRVVMERVPAQLDRQLVAPERHPFFAPFERLPAAVPAARAAALRERVRASIGSGVLPALRRLRAFLSDEYLPAAPVEIGVGRMPNGAAIYAYLLH